MKKEREKIYTYSIIKKNKKKQQQVNRIFKINK